MNANEVIRIGRRRNFTAASVASRRDRPDSRLCLANSTIRIAFLLARPTSTTKPICVKMLMSEWEAWTPSRVASQSQWVNATPVSEPRMHIGTTRMTASGSAQLSYCAASTRNTNTTASGKIRLFQTFLAASTWMKLISVHSKFMPCGSVCLASRSISMMPSPELTPGFVLPTMAAAGYML